MDEVLGTDMELVDLRAKITARAHQVLTAKSMATGKDISEVAREVLDSFAVNEIHSASLVLRLTRSEDMTAASKGTQSPNGGKQ